MQKNTSQWQIIIAGLQMLFVAFGALVLMPIITGLDPSVALFTAGVGTLVFQLVTKRSVPVFLASSFVFIAPILLSVKNWGIPATMGALMAAGCLYLVLALLVKLKGTAFLHTLMPPVVTGPIIMVIGLSLAPVAVNFAMGKTGDGATVLFENRDALIVSLSTLLVTLLVATQAKGLFRLLPILAGVVFGYLVSWCFGMPDFTKVSETSWFAVPNFVMPEFHIQAILFMLPVAIAPAIEHVGDILAISNVTGKRYVDKPGLHRTLSGDGLATIVAGLFGGPPNTTYSEVTGAVMLTKIFNVAVMTWAAVFAICFAFIAKLGIFLQSIPTPVMGGILVLLFGSIAVVGINILVRAKVDLNHQRNTVIVATTLVFGVGGMAIGSHDWNLKGVSLCGLIAIALNWVLPGRETPDPEFTAEQEVIEAVVPEENK